MVEIISEDVMDWARDLTVLRKLFAGDPPTDLTLEKQTVIIELKVSTSSIKLRVAAETT